MDGWSWALMILMLVTFWAAVLVAAIVIARSGERPRQHQRSAEEILAERLADGLITVEEYEQRVVALRGERVGPRV